MNILIPMAGDGTRFKKEGIKIPKPLVDVMGKSMVQRVVDSLEFDASFIFIVREQHIIDFKIDELLNEIAPNCKILTTDKLTEGAACTALLAKDYINNEKELLICDVDSLVYFDKSLLKKDGFDAAIMTFIDSKTCWSFVESQGHLKEIFQVAEKKPISNYASSGRYYWKRGHDFVYYAEMMIKENFRVNGEFYISPVFNYAIKDKNKVLNIVVDKFNNLGTPEDLNEFITQISSFDL